MSVLRVRQKGKVNDLMLDLNTLLESTKIRMCLDLAIQTQVRDSTSKALNCRDWTEAPEY